MDVRTVAATGGVVALAVDFDDHARVAPQEIDFDELRARCA